jgi:hypothetical protein
MRTRMHNEGPVAEQFVDATPEPGPLRGSLWVWGFWSLSIPHLSPGRWFSGLTRGVRACPLYTGLYVHCPPLMPIC